MTTTFQSRVRQIEAFRWSTPQLVEPPQWFLDACQARTVEIVVPYPDCPFMETKTPKGMRVARPGDWILLIDGKVAFMSDEEFRATFEPCAGGAATEAARG